MSSGQLGGEPSRSSDQTGDDEISQLLDSLTSDRTADAVSGRRRSRQRSLVPAFLAGAAGMAVLVALGSLIWFVATSRAENGTAEIAADLAGPERNEADLQDDVDQLSDVLGVAGLPGVRPEIRGSTIYLTGAVEDSHDRQTALDAAATLGSGVEVDASELLVLNETEAGATAAPDSRPQTLERELDRILATTPIIYGTGQTSLTELQQRILNSVASLLLSYQEVPVRIVGYTDDFGSDEDNARLSEIRALAVRDYLVSQGVPEAGLTVVGAGETTSTGAVALSGLERRVEIEVTQDLVPAADLRTIRVGVVAPSAEDDLAFTQSMVDAVNLIAAERSKVQVEVVDSTFIPDDVAVAMRDFGSRDFDLIVAHGSQFGPQVSEIAAEFPNTAIAWGTAGVDPGFPNVYAYDVAAEEGGYVLGALAALLSTSNTLGVVGPIEVGDAQRYINGFEAGATDQNQATRMEVAYIGSFTDTALAAEAAHAQLDAGADILTGSSQMVIGAVAAVSEREALWIGNQANQASLAPTSVVASQVYHWEVILRPIIADIDLGTMNGRLLTANLANGGIVIERNPGFPFSDTAETLVVDLTAAIASGTIDPSP